MWGRGRLHSLTYLMYIPFDHQWDDAGGKMYRVTKSGTYIIKDGNLAELGMGVYR